MKEVIMPKLGLTMTEGTINEWFKAEGEAVEKGEPLFAVTTDKLTNDIQSPESGVLVKILVPADETTAVQSVVALIDEAGTASKPEEKHSAAPAPESAGKQEPVEEPRGGIVTPLAAKIAASRGISLEEIRSRRITAREVEAFETHNEGPQEEAKPMSAMRKAIAKNMLASKETSPTVTFDISCDMRNAKALREQLKTLEKKISYTDIIVKCTAKALKEFPLLNCSVDGNKIIYKNYVNVGVAVALPDGLLVPNIPDTDKKSVFQISEEIKSMAAACRGGKAPMERLSGGTFTVTNLGMYGIESFTPIINQPEVAILGVNAMKDVLALEQGCVVAVPTMKLSLTADHRVIDGSVAAEFLQKLKQYIENPITAIYE